jgi:hypothetical protein
MMHLPKEWRLVQAWRRPLRYPEATISIVPQLVTGRG